MVKVIKTTTNFNQAVYIDKGVHSLINTLDCYYGVGNRGYYELLRSTSLFRGVQSLTIACEQGLITCEWIEVDHYIEPDYVALLGRYIRDNYGDDAAEKLGY